ncbi:hypothetical protein GLOIN_2v986619 [Rhizophagus clarus]|uniref:Uncharacterized protein n=1 Tax=Rhizophagus clarus TaxID=94130 RepID=A0A8H3L848_9GLOM|nr:hypothetical protein GLOIN_2v986619 [Rhizophagus clarus]
MSGSHINRSRSGKYIDIILNEVYNKSVPKPINLRPGYDIEYIRNCYRYHYPGQFKKMVEVEKIYNDLSIISSYETPQQWATQVKNALQALITGGYRSYYYEFCLFASFGQGITKTYYDNYEEREVTIGYQRPNIHNSKMAICFDCWKLVKIPDVKPKKTYFNGWQRYGYEIKPEDLMIHHWDNECFKVNKYIEVHLLARAKSEILCEKFSHQKRVLYPKNTPNTGKLFISSLHEVYNVTRPLLLSGRASEIKNALHILHFDPNINSGKEYLYVKTVEYLTSVKTEYLMAGSVIYQGLEENPWISKDKLRGVIEKAVNLIKNSYGIDFVRSGKLIQIIPQGSQNIVLVY